jgi:hypothetical protein
VNRPRTDGATAAHFAASAAHVHGSRVLRWLASRGGDVGAKMAAANGGQRPVDVILGSGARATVESAEAVRWLREWERDADEL